MGMGMIIYISNKALFCVDTNYQGNNEFASKKTIRIL
jgi:hypothetical protein